MKMPMVGCMAPIYCTEPADIGRFYFAGEPALSRAVQVEAAGGSTRARHFTTLPFERNCVMREPTAAEVRKQLEELETTYRQRKRRLRALLGVLELDEPKQEPES